MSDVFEDLIARLRPGAPKSEPDLALQIAVDRARGIISDIYEIAGVGEKFEVTVIPYDRRCRCDATIAAIALVEFEDGLEVIGYCDGCSALVKPILEQFSVVTEGSR
jgi:hypothetical protein